MDEAEHPVARGRRSYALLRWEEAYAAFAEADRADPLTGADLQRLAMSAGLTGRDDEMLAVYERLYRERLDAGDTEGAANAAFWIGMRSFAMNRAALANGWLERVKRLVEGHDWVEHGYLLVPAFHRTSRAGRIEEAAQIAAAAVEIGNRFGDRDLVALARNLHGRALVRLGRVEEGLALTDEAMVAATGGELSPVVTGLVYCSVIACCQWVYALDRAREWTSALAAWCASQPQMVPFSGTCLIHRSEILQLGGEWGTADKEAERAAERLALAGDPAGVADAYYQRAEIHRLRGELAAAEEGYRAASGAGRDPYPGLALLRLAQGRPDAAAAGLARVVAAASNDVQRARHLPAHVEVLLAVGDVAGADEACTLLEAVGSRFDSGMLRAMANHARGAVCLARGDAPGALEPLRSAFDTWQRLDVPYLAARSRVLLGRACEALGDPDGAALAWEAARQVFRELGAATDLEPLPRGPGTPDLGLTPREHEVLRLLASGRTNKAIGRALFVSVRTVDRHVSNLFIKLGVSSRAAATAWAYEHGLVGRG